MNTDSISQTDGISSGKMVFWLRFSSSEKCFWWSSGMIASRREKITTWRIATCTICLKKNDYVLFSWIKIAHFSDRSLSLSYWDFRCKPWKIASWVQIKVYRSCNFHLQNALVASTRQIETLRQEGCYEMAAQAAVRLLDEVAEHARLHRYPCPGCRVIFPGNQALTSCSNTSKTFRCSTASDAQLSEYLR